MMEEWELEELRKDDDSEWKYTNLCDWLRDIRTTLKIIIFLLVVLVAQSFRMTGDISGELWW